MKYLGKQYGKQQFCGNAQLTVTLQGVYDKTCANGVYVVFHRERHFESLYSCYQSLGVSLPRSEIEPGRETQAYRLAKRD